MSTDESNAPKKRPKWKSKWNSSMGYSVYAIEHRESGRMYIGEAKDVKTRWHNHGRSPHMYISRAIQKYGKDAFDFWIVETFGTADEAFEAEKYWIARLETRDPSKGFNLTDGGEGNSGWSPSPETRAAISATLTGRVLVQESDAINRFFSYVDKNGPSVDGLEGNCHLWVGPIDKNGHGYLTFRRLYGRVNSSKQASRVAFYIKHEQWPDAKIYLIQKCKNKLCVNIGHAVEVTRKEINKSHRKTAKGSNAGSAKLTESEAMEIRYALSLGYSRSFVAEAYNLTVPTVSCIESGKSWKHLPLVPRVAFQ